MSAALPVPAAMAEAPSRFFLGVAKSARGRAWRDRLDTRGTALALAIAQRHGVPDMLARILAGRGVEAADAESYLDPTVKRLMPDPETLTGMREAAARIADAIQRCESVAIFGDYDVDGATSSALLARYLRHFGLNPVIHIPDRLFEGYGPNVDAIRALAERGATLLVTVDCGTTSIEPLTEAKRLGLDTLVIDHHQCDPVLPPALAIVNPNRLDDLSGLNHLAAVGLGVHDAGRGEPRIAPARCIRRNAPRARSAWFTRSGRARHHRGCCAAQGSQPGLRLERADFAAAAREFRPDRADGRGAPRRAAGALSSRLPARAAHQCRRPHRARRSRRQLAA